MKQALIVSCFDWYKRRLKPLREILMERGYAVTVLTSDFDHITKTRIEKRFDACTYVPVKQYQKNISFSRIQSHFQFAKTVERQLEALQPGLVYVLVPPNSVGKRCADYRKKHPETKLILDIIDLWPESMPLERLKNTLPMKLWKAWRTETIQAADHVFTECNLYQKQLRDALDSAKTSTLYLHKEQSEEERSLIRHLIAERQRTRDHKTVKLAYVGSMNSIIDIAGICGVIRGFIKTGFKTELHAVGTGESKDEFEKRVKETGCETVFYGPIFDETQKIRILTPCDYALNMMVDTVSVGLTIKSIDYLSYGLPIINNIKEDTRNLVETLNLGVNTDGADGESAAISLEDRPIDRGAILDTFERYFSVNAFRQEIENALARI